MQNQLQFRISSALKDIIGKDLITDDFIAIFELVKNAFDAHSTTVDIIFKNIYSENPTIIIKDDGKGMNLDDINNKWLFVAYSAKKEGTEDDNYDYRNSIFSRRAFAGAKGIGRFSCDRLGMYLYLETLKNEPNSKIETLLTDWERFENSIRSEFVDISVIHESRESGEYLRSHGTALEISQLRANWDRTKILRLKNSLSKLINPNENREYGDFVINIIAEEELEKDNSIDDVNFRVNGEVRNYIYQALDWKTTKIVATISEDGKTVTTELRDGGTIIYRIVEKNNTILLSNITYTLYYLNLSAKLTFHKRMGLATNKFGHVFVYKQGFRIYPYGEPGQDPFRIDARKAQGRNRYLGTSDLMGQIEIWSNDEELKETSSRGDGFIKTNTYDQLEDYFIEVLRRLEKYVVDVQQWGLSMEDDDSHEMKERASSFIAKLTGGKDIVEFSPPDNFIELIESSQANSANSIITNLKKLALDSDNVQLASHANVAANRLLELQSAKEEVEKQLLDEMQRADQATVELKERVSENLFLKSINSSDLTEVISLMHHIGIYAGTIDNHIRGISLRIQNNIPLSNDELYNIIRTISFETKKILNVSAFATKAKFKLDTEEKEINFREYISEYVQNIIPSITDKDLKIKLVDNSVVDFVRVVKPIELNIVIDNIINNAKKSRANNVRLELNTLEGDIFQMKFINDGIPILESNMSKLYEIGFTTTDGSGIGLHHVAEIVKSMGAKISATNNIEEKGVTFTIEIK